MRQTRYPELSCQRGLGFFLALLLLTVPLPWLAAAWIAASVHELLHLFALRQLGHPVTQIRIGVFGAGIQTVPLSPRDELICALAGPFGALLLLPFARWLPLVCLFGAVQSLFNLIPVYPMDGGRAVRSAFCLLGFKANVFEYFEAVICAGTVALSLWVACRWDFGLWPVAAGAYIVFPALWKK